MKVVVDTPIWSLALRRRRGDLSANDSDLVAAWSKLVRDNLAVMIGPVRQEILSGIRDHAVFERLRDSLRAFDDEPLTLEDYEEAARCSNRCRSAGLAGSAVDYLLCAVALRRQAWLFTTDMDFTRYAKYLPLRLFSPSHRKP
jgi:hypothetical protein